MMILGPNILIFFLLQMDASEHLQDFFDAEFKKYLIVPKTFGEKAKLKWKSDKKAKRYRTRLQEIWDAAKAPNFAGHYYAANEIGCGSGCRVIFVIDWNTGEIFYPKEDEPIEVRKESELMILNPYAICGKYDPPILYRFKAGQFHKIRHAYCSRKKN